MDTNSLANAIVRAAPLRPEVRLQRELAAFEEALAGSGRNLFDSYRRGGLPDVTAITRLTAEIDLNAGKTHRSWHSKGHRLTNVLIAVHRMAPVGDVVVGGAQNLVASGVWAAVRLCLEAATASIKYFDKLSALILEVGRTAPIQQELALLYPKSPELRGLLCEYMAFMVQLCRHAILFIKKSPFAQFTSAALSSFDSDFGGLKERLSTLGIIIEKQVSACFIRGQLQEADQAKKSRSLIRGLLSGTERAIREQRLFRLFGTLSQDRHLYEGIRRWERSKGTAKWLLSNVEYMKWKRKNKSACLFVQGKLGCGKTVLLANIVDDLYLDKSATDPSSPCIAYFFCRSDVPKTLQGRVIAGTLARQIIGHPGLATHVVNFKNTEEIHEYVISEMARRSLLWPDDPMEPVLYEAVQETLTTYADGMYLWVSLMIEEIFPENDPRPSDDEIFECLKSLPKTLPAAYDQALKRITLQKYSRTLFQCIAGARRPLALKEIQEAINVSPGNSTWNQQTVARDISRLVQNAGGSLLTVNEETLTVHYVHHTALHHLLLPLQKETTLSHHHFTLEEAHRQLCGITITYLSYGDFENRVATIPAAFNIATSNVPQKVVTNAISRKLFPPSISRMLFEGQSARAPIVDIVKIIEDARANLLAQKYELHAFLPYAQEHWLHHSRSISEEGSQVVSVYSLWLKLIRGNASVAATPWRDLDEDALEWAFCNAHEALLLYFFTDLNKPFTIQRNLTKLFGVISREPQAAPLSPGYLQDFMARLVFYGVSCNPDYECVESSTVIKVIKHFKDKTDVNAHLSDRLSSDYHLTPLAMIFGRRNEPWLSVARLLLQSGADPDLPSGAFGLTPIEIVAAKNWSAAVYMLGDFNVDPNKATQGTSALCKAMQFKEPFMETVYALLSIGASPFYPRGASPLRSILTPGDFDFDAIFMFDKIIYEYSCGQRSVASLNLDEQLEARDILTLLPLVPQSLRKRAGLLRKLLFEGQLDPGELINYIG